MKLALREVFRNEALIGGNVEEFCAPPPGPDDDALDMLPCSAGHTACYVSPYGDVYPCVQFPSAERKRAADEVRGHLARFAAAQGGAVDHFARHAVLFQVCAWRNVYAMSGVGVPGREYARTLDAGLREIFRPDRDSLCQFDGEEICCRRICAELDWCRFKVRPRWLRWRPQRPPDSCKLSFPLKRRVPKVHTPCQRVLLGARRCLRRQSDPRRQTCDGVE